MSDGEVEEILLRAADSHQLTASVAMPGSQQRGGLVLLHEIFGVTPQMRETTARFAQAGYKVICPALFDRVNPGTVLNYDQMEQGRELIAQLKLADVMLDIEAAVQQVSCDAGVAVVGYCWGGGVAYLSACELDIQAAVSFYGTRMLSYLEHKPRCPCQFHFGELDKAIPLTDVEQIRSAIPDENFHIYTGAGQGMPLPMTPGPVTSGKARPWRRSGCLLFWSERWAPD